MEWFCLKNVGNSWEIFMVMNGIKKDWEKQKQLKKRRKKYI